MDNIRLLLFFALAFILLALYQAWQDEYGVSPIESVSSGTSQQPVESAAPSAEEEEGVPTAPASDDALPQTPRLVGDANADSGDAKIRVQTDLFDIVIDTRGGTVSSAHLRDYPRTLDNQYDKLQLLAPAPPKFFIAQSGLLGAAEGLAPAHTALFQSEQSEFRMTDDQDELTVTLTWTHESGVIVNKHYRFTRGSHNIQVDHEVINNGPEIWSGRDYGQLQRVQTDEEGQSAFMYTYMGGAFFSPDKKYQKVSFDDMKDSNLAVDVSGGWVSMLQHYFVAAWIPPSDATHHSYTKVLSADRYVIGNYPPSVSVAPGASHTFTSHLYVGPKLQRELETVATGLDLTRDYGWLAVLAQPMFWLLDQIHKLVNNWGWAIIIFTILLKLVLYPLSATSYKSMAGMKKLGPRIQALKDRYGDDKQRMQQAMMDIYKKEKINPLGGCLPILVQIPFFIALYWVLLESVELRQAPWILWIDDLSTKDPYFVLPVLMGVSMFVQQKLNPQPPDPMQAKIMMSMPFVFTIFFAFFPSGLVLYWFVNNLFSIAQQWYITKNLEKEGS
jgi:YidC/Oxa1 family membrane protein insertase